MAREMGKRGLTAWRLSPLGVIVLLAAILSPADAAARNPVGSLKQLAGTAGCYTTDGSSEDGPGTCRDIRGGADTTGVVLSPDGRFAYINGYGSGPVGPVISIFKRNRKTGGLRQLGGIKGCISSDGSSEDGPATCTNVRALNVGDGHDLVISSDGRFLYGASQDLGVGAAGGLIIFRRSVRRGTLKQLGGLRGCVTDDGASEDGPGTCRDGEGLEDASSVHVSPDQRFLYATNYDEPQAESGIAIFRRSIRRGGLSQLGGVNGCITQDGTTEASGPNPVCRVGTAIGDPFELVTPDNRFVYMANREDSLVAVFRRNRRGGLVQLAGKLGCISDDGSSLAGPDTCRKARALEDAERIVLSKDTRFLFVAGFSPDDIATLKRNRRTGALSQQADPKFCISEDGSSVDGPGTCQEGRALDGGYAGDLSKDGRTLYYASNGESGFVIVRVNRRTGAIKQLAGLFGCVTTDGDSDEQGPDTCTDGRSVESVYGITVGGRRGRDVYVAVESGIAHFHAVTPRRRR